MRTLLQRANGGQLAVTAGLAIVALGVFVGLVAIITAIGGGEPSAGSLAIATLTITLGFEPTRRRLRSSIGEHDDGRATGAVDHLVDGITRYDDPEAALAEMAATIRAGLGARSAMIWAEIDRMWVPLAAAPGGAQPSAPLGEMADLAGDTVVPIVRDARPIGAIALDFDRDLRSSELKLLDDIASGSAVVVRLAALRRSIHGRLRAARHQHDELARLRTATDRAQLEERRRLERNLHDTCQQRAVVVAGKLGLICRTSDPETIRRLAVETRDDLTLLTASIDRVAAGESPLTLIGGGLAGALYAEAAAMTVPTDVIDLTDARFDRVTEECVYACCLEAMRNASRHGKPSGIVVRLHARDGQLRFEVDDDGSGFDHDATVDGTGLHNMRSRVRELGGRIHIDSGSHGTSVVGLVPASPIGVGA